MTEAEKSLNRAIGERLRAARNARGLSLSEVATLTGGLFSKSRISNYEQGIRRMSLEAAAALSAALGNVTAPHLLCLDVSSAEQLGEEEQRLLNAYRSADPEARQRLLECAGSVAG
jgi:transcriptional regulator with XRE-family HTH domain